MRIGEINFFQSQIICWSLSVMFAVLAIAWGFVSIKVTKPFTDAEREFIGVIAAVFAFLAVLFIRLAVRAKKKRDDQVASYEGSSVKR
jgi:hypothetical protein